MNIVIKEKIYKYFLRKLPPIWVAKFTHFRMHKRFGSHAYIMDLKNPKTFNEKIKWLNIYSRPKYGKVVADKLRVRNYVTEKIGSEYLIPLLNVYDNSETIDFRQLPARFVLKPNHGSGWVILCDDKNQLNTENILKKLQMWCNLDFYFLSGEWQYRGIERKIICEKLIEEIVGIVDYKFFCFNGMPMFVQVDLDRHARHVRSFYDLEWEKMDTSLMYPPTDKIIDKPKSFGEMIEIAKTLSKDFTFCRVDLYEVNGKIYFGEITLHPGGGNEPFGSYEEDLVMGQYLDVEINKWGVRSVE
jgi:hypothetical protein